MIDSLAPGGAEGSLLEMVAPLRDEGIDVSIAVLRDAPRGAAEPAPARGRVTRVPGTSLPAQVRHLRRLLRAARPAVLHTTLFRANLVGRLAAWGTGIPVVTSLVSTAYDPVRGEDPRLPRRRFRLVRAADRWSARRLTRHFHAITHAVKDAAVRDLGIPPERITVIERGRAAARLGRRTEERRARARAALGLAADDEVVLHAGRHVFAKGQRYLLEAMDALGGARPRLVLLLAGREGSTTEDLRRIAGASRWRDRIRILGHREDVPELLAAADVFAFPSLYEGLGGALIEAMALSLPIVASDLAATREVLEAGGNAILVERGSASSLAAALAEILDDPPRATRLGRRSREIFDARFRLKDVVARTAALYRRVAEEGTP